MIRIAVLGAGHWGPNPIRNFHSRERSEVVWVVDPDVTRTAAVKARFPEIKTSPDAGPVFADPSIDAVVIATPASVHYQLARMALESGKHVLVEKPMTTDVRQGEELLALAERAKRVLMVGHVFLFNPGVRRVKRYLDEGFLGRVYYVSMIRTNLGPIRMDVSAAWDLAAHDVSIVNYWLGSEPLAVSAIGGTWINPGIEDAIFATFRYRDDVFVNLHCSWLNPRKSRDITVVGERSMLTFDDMNLSEPLRLYDKQVTEDRTAPGYVDSFASFRASVREGDITIPKVALGEPLKVECDHFLDCIETGAAPESGAREGLGVVRALEALHRSARNRGREECL